MAQGTKLDSKVVERGAAEFGKRKPTKHKKHINLPTDKELHDWIQKLLNDYPNDDWTLILIRINEICDAWVDKIQAIYHLEDQEGDE